MRKMLIQRPSALPAVCTLVPELPMTAAEAAHALAGYGMAAMTAELGAALTRSPKLSQEQWLTQGAQVRIDGTNGFAAKPSAIDLDPVGGVRGIPPRGWPV